MNKALLSSKNMCWCTPQDFFDKLNQEFQFVLDPAATDKTAKCPLYYTPETDGLSQSWDRGGAVFCNPPYGREIGKWVKKAFIEARGDAKIAAMKFDRDAKEALYKAAQEAIQSYKLQMKLTEAQIEREWGKSNA